MKLLGVGEVVALAGTKYRKAAAIAAGQRGRVCRAQLLAAGITVAQIKHLVATEFLVPLHRGVYAAGHLAPVTLGRETAALLACPERAVLSHRSAAAAWTIHPYDEIAPVEVTVPASSGMGRRPGIVVHRTRRLDPKDVRVHRGLPITSPARTLLDSTAQLTDRELERALDEALIQRIVRLDEVRDVIGRHPRRPRAARLGALVRERREPAVTRSELEERFLSLIRKAGLPPPKVNYRLLGFLIDFYWEEQQVAFELDGYRFHSTRSAFERDRRKDAILKSAQVDVNRVTWTQLTEEPYAVIVLVAQRLMARRG